MGPAVSRDPARPEPCDPRSLDPVKLVGCSPLIELRHLDRPGDVRIFAKLEGQNPSGSVKDRIARGLVELAEERGLIAPGATLVEATTGNMGIALAFVGRQKGYHVKTVIPRGVAPSIQDVLELMGVEIVWCEPRVGMKGAIDLAHELAERNGWHAVRQFANPGNLEIHYRTTGAEIAYQMPDLDVFVAGIGTGGTIMGAGRRLRELNPKVRLVGVEPKVGDRLQGLRSFEEGFIPPLLDLSKLDGRYLVDSCRALELSAQVAAREGLLVGVSAGATLTAALRVAETMERGKIVVMFSDSGWKYLPAHPWQAARERDKELDDIHWW